MTVTTDDRDALIGRRVRDRREALVMTQAKLCEVLQVSRPTYIASEDGRRSFTSKEIRLLAATFDCAVSDLVADREQITDSPHQLLRLAALAEKTHQLLSGDISEGCYAKYVGKDRVSAREMAAKVKLAAEILVDLPSRSDQ